MRFTHYDAGEFFDEMFGEQCQPRPIAEALVHFVDALPCVLGDDVRCPSGASYVLEQRAVMKRTLPQVFESSRIRPVDDYPGRLRDMLEYLSPPGIDSPRVVVLTPGFYNSAYFEHS